MKRKKGKRRQWTRRKKRNTAELDEGDAGEMMMKKKKKMDGTETTTTEAAGWSSSGVAELPLPLDVWGDIFSRLPFKQVLVCRCICRAWNALLARVYYHHHPNPTTPATLLYYPLFSRLQSHQMRLPLGNYLTLAELRNGAPYVSTVTRIKDHYTCRIGADGDGDGDPDDNFLWPVASCHGLVCFVRKIDRCDDRNLFVGNPLLKEHLLLVRPSQIHMKTEVYFQWSEVVGFGFSPSADRYKILKWCHADEEDQSHLLICTVGDGSRRSCRGRGRGRRKVCTPSCSWRDLLSFPRHFWKYSCPPGSHLNAGFHWLVLDKDNSVYISRLDLDTEQFGRIEAPQSPDFNIVPFTCLSMSASDGHLIICAALNLDGQDIIDIWVMNQFNLWTKNLVVRCPVPPNCTQHMEVLNYGKVEVAAREGAVAEVMLFVRRSRLYACTTRGRHVRQLDRPSRDEDAIIHIPSLLSIKDAAKL